MKRNLKDHIKNFNEHIVVYCGIALIVLFMFAISWIIVSGVVAAIMAMLQIPFSWYVVSVVWVLCVIALKLYAKKIERDINEVERLKFEP